MVVQKRTGQMHRAGRSRGRGAPARRCQRRRAEGREQPSSPLLAAPPLLPCKRPPPLRARPTGQRVATIASGRASTAANPPVRLRPRPRRSALLVHPHHRQQVGGSPFTRARMCAETLPCTGARRTTRQLLQHHSDILNPCQAGCSCLLGKLGLIHALA